MLQVPIPEIHSWRAYLHMDENHELYIPPFRKKEKSISIDFDQLVLSGATRDLSNKPTGRVGNNRSNLKKVEGQRRNQKKVRSAFWSTSFPDIAGKNLFDQLLRHSGSILYWKELINHIESEIEKKLYPFFYSTEFLACVLEHSVTSGYIPISLNRNNPVFIEICIKWAKLGYESTANCSSSRDRFKWILTHHIGLKDAKLYLEMSRSENQSGKREVSKQILQKAIQKGAEPQDILWKELESLDQECVSATSSLKSSQHSFHSQDSFNFTETTISGALKKLLDTHYDEDDEKSTQSEVKSKPKTVAATTNPSAYFNTETDKENINQVSTVPLNHAHDNICAQKPAVYHSQENLTIPAALQATSERFYVNSRVYFKLEIVGKGGSGLVYKVMNKDFKIFALKRVKFDPTEHEKLESIRNEISLLQSLRGKPHIIHLFDWENDSSKEEIRMLFEFGEIDLSTVLKKKTCSTTNMNSLKSIWQQMLEAVQVIHNERIVHGDLKPSNFLFVKGDLKLIDFGISKALSNDTTHIERASQIGTLNYISPEAIKGSDVGEEKYKLGRQSDIWSLGCILYQMVYGHTPFFHIKRMLTKLYAITDPKFPITYDRADPVAVDVLKCCLQRNPSNRPTIPQLLTHPFLSSPENSFSSSKDDTIREIISKMKKAGIVGPDMDHDEILKTLSGGSPNK